MTDTSSLRQGKIYDDHTDPNVNLYFASYDDIDELCQVINWAYRGKPSTSNPEQLYSGWIGEQHLLTGARIAPNELKKIIDNEQSCAVLVAKLKTGEGEKIVGCWEISLHEEKSDMIDEGKNDRAVEFGLNAVDPDYQSRGIGTLLFNAAIRVAKEYFNARCVYSYIISSKKNQIEWCLRQGFIDTGRFKPFPFYERMQPKVDLNELNFSILTKRL